MIVVRVELHHATQPGKVTELARMDLANISGTSTKGDYSCQSYRGRDRATLAKRIVQRKGQVLGHPRLSQHVWYLVAKALKALNYDH